MKAEGIPALAPAAQALAKATTTARKGRKSILKANTGKEFESTLEAVFEGYRKRGIADVQKVDPPVRVVGPPKFKRVILLENPWLDFVGTWTEMGGRMLVIEAKSTEEPRLELGDGGFTKAQQDAMARWHRSGALTGLVWYHGGAVKVITHGMVQMALEMGVKSFKWRHLPGTPKGEGWVLWDVLEVLATTK